MRCPIFYKKVRSPIFYSADLGSGSQGDSRKVTEQESEVLAEREQISGWPPRWSFSKLLRLRQKPEELVLSFVWSMWLAATREEGI